MEPAREFEMNAAALKALAHPLRVQILRILQLRERASVTSLADELGETTGATSYHLRQLARHGLVEPSDPPAGKTRQQWWQMAVDEIHISGFDFMANAQTREAMGFLLRESTADRARRLTNWYASATQWPEEWQRASSDADSFLQLDPVQTRALADELRDLVARFREVPPGAGARKVDVQYAIFPAGSADER